MLSHVVEPEHQKRKRDIDDGGSRPERPQHAPEIQQEHDRYILSLVDTYTTGLKHTLLSRIAASSLTKKKGVPQPIQYLPMSRCSHLNLIQGDANTFSNIISLIGEYESVIDKGESFAINLGARLTGPRLLRGIEKFFDGPICTLECQPFANPVSWLDIVGYARSNPEGYTLISKTDGTRWCQFYVNGKQIEITEDDWRLVWSSALDRFPLDQPLKEDEAAELATLDILEQRTSMLYKQADEVAARARILNRKLNHRRQDIQRRCDVLSGTVSGPPSVIQSHGESKKGSSFDLHADLLQQFMAVSASLPPSLSTLETEPALSSTGSQSSSHSNNQGCIAPKSSSRHYSGSAPEPVADIRLESYRSLITHNVDRLQKGDEVRPPCDRCRRLRISCIKHLTACAGCTKKHAKCSWRAVTDAEVGQLKKDIGFKGNEYRDDEREGGSDASDATVIQEHGRISSERSAGATLAVLKDCGSRSPSRDGPQLTTLEPPISVLMNRFDLNDERHRLSLGKGPADLSPEVSQHRHSSSMTMAGTLAMVVTTNGRSINDSPESPAPRNT